MDRPKNRILLHRQVGQQLQRRDSRHRHVSLSAPCPVCQTTHYPDGMSTSSLGYYVNRIKNLHVSRVMWIPYVSRYVGKAQSQKTMDWTTLDYWIVLCLLNTGPWDIHTYHRLFIISSMCHYKDWDYDTMLNLENSIIPL